MFKKKDILIIIAILLVAIVGLFLVRKNTSKTPSLNNPSSDTSSTSNVETKKSSTEEKNQEPSPPENAKLAITDPVYAEIYSNNELILEIGLSDTQVITVPQKEAVQIEIRDGEIGFIKSDCPDKVCIHTGFMSKPGYMSACLPNGVVVVVVANELVESSTQNGGVDATS